MDASTLRFIMELADLLGKAPCIPVPSAWSFYVRNPRDSVLADEGSAGLRSHGTNGRLSDKGTVNAGRDSCGLVFFLH